MGNLCCKRKKSKKKVVLLLVGLDNAGKTAAAKGLAGEPLNKVVPTVGFSIVHLNYKDFNVKVYDLGGSSNIRAIWQKYFVDAHGIIFVVDSSDYDRLDEAKTVLNALLSHEKIAGKPVLLLANKQDHEEALDEIDVIEKLQLERLVNKEQCPTLVESCSATDISNKSKLDPGIKKGYHWLLNYILHNYKILNERVESDVREQESLELAIRMNNIKRIKSMMNSDRSLRDDVIEIYSEEKVHDQHCNIFIVQSTNEVEEKRPESATQWVKEQLRLNNEEPTFLLHRPKLNKTTPVSLYGTRRTFSAGDRRSRNISKYQRNLKSAGERKIQNGSFLIT